MSAISRQAMPEKHDLVIGVVTKIQKHGVYISLKEYENVVGYCHISEVAGAWIRNIRNFVRIDQTVVAKVLRVDTGTHQVDVSLKRVSEQQKKEKSLDYKHKNAAIAMLNLIAEKAGKSIAEIRDIIEDPIADIYGGLYNGFEELVAVGLHAFDDIDIPEELKIIIHDVAETSIQISTVSINYLLLIRSFASDGILHVKKLLEAAQTTAKKFPDVTSEVTCIGSPSYRISLEGLSFPEVDEVYQEIKKELEIAGKELNLEYKIEQEG